MDIDFADARLRETCNNQKRLVKTHGERRARKIRLRLDQLRAAATLAEFQHVHRGCHPLHYDREGEWAADLDGGYRLIFEANHSPLPTRADGVTLDIEKITAVKILEVTDYHGG